MATKPFYNFYNEKVTFYKVPKQHGHVYLVTAVPEEKSPSASTGSNPKSDKLYNRIIKNKCRKNVNCTEKV